MSTLKSFLSRFFARPVEVSTDFIPIAPKSGEETDQSVRNRVIEMVAFYARAPLDEIKEDMVLGELAGAIAPALAFDLGVAVASNTKMTVGELVDQVSRAASN